MGLSKAQVRSQKLKYAAKTSSTLPKPQVRRGVLEAYLRIFTGPVPCRPWRCCCTTVPRPGGHRPTLACGWQATSHADGEPPPTCPAKKTNKKLQKQRNQMAFRLKYTFEVSGTLPQAQVRCHKLKYAATSSSTLSNPQVRCHMLKYAGA